MFYREAGIDMKALEEEDDLIITNQNKKVAELIEQENMFDMHEEALFHQQATAHFGSSV